MAGLHYVIEGLNVLQDYPDIREYIKNFNGSHGFMYTTDSDAYYNADIEKQMEQILDPTGIHSGCSWGCMMRGIQAVLTGSTTREEIEEQIFESDKRFNEFMREVNLAKTQEQLLAEREERQIFRQEIDPTTKHS